MTPEERLAALGVRPLPQAETPATPTPGKGGNATATALSSKRRATKERPSWLVGATCDDRGRVLPNLANLMIALRAVPEIADAFRFDEMMRAPILTRELPLVERTVGELGPYPRPVRDTDVSQLQEWLQREGLPRIGMEMTYQAVNLRAQERSFHPLRDYLGGLVWDGTPRLDRWLSRYLGAEPSAYVTAIGRMFLIAMVARIFEPGCKADYMPVFEGEQGAYKSAACSVLAGQWFSDNLPDVLRDKDAAQHIRGKWLIEVAELSATNRAETEHLKAFITRQTERYRPSYGRLEVVEPRQCIFVGTTNKSTYLRDETGGRRFWPVKVGRVDVEALRRDRDQLFAEAAHHYRLHAKWWPDETFEREHIRPQQNDRFEGDPWDEAIAAHVATLSRVRVTDIARNVLAIESAKVGTSEQRRIAAVLTGLGWKPVRDWLGRAYVRPGEEHDA
jgi:predicted P-loop ATPase